MDSLRFDVKHRSLRFMVFKDRGNVERRNVIARWEIQWGKCDLTAFAFAFDVHLLTGDRCVGIVHFLQ